jgi:hypothetical protein
MSRLALAPLLALTLAAPASAESRASVGADARKALALTIYAQDLAVVRETRAVTLPTGESVLRFTDVPDSLDPRTVALRSVTKPAALQVRQQSLRWDLASADTLLRRYVGHQVDLIETERLRDRVTSAVLLSPTGPLLQIGDQISVGHPGRLSLPPIEPALYTTPTLEWLVTNAGPEAQDVEVGYSTSGLSWTADYVLTLAPTGTTASLTAWITITNQSAVRWADAHVALLAGTVRTVEEARPLLARGMAMAAMSTETMPKAQQVLDYQRYSLERPTTIEPSVTTQVPLLEAEDVPVQKQYRVESSPPWQRQAPPGDEGEALPVSVAFDLRNDADSHLGVPLPSGVMRVYAPAEGGGVERGAHRARGARRGGAGHGGRGQRRRRAPQADRLPEARHQAVARRELLRDHAPQPRHARRGGGGARAPERAVGGDRGEPRGPADRRHHPRLRGARARRRRDGAALFGADRRVAR